MKKITGAVPGCVFMKPKQLKGINRRVKKTYKRRNRGRNIALFTFDDKGEYLIEDETKFTDDVMLKIKKLGYKVVEEDSKPLNEEKVIEVVKEEKDPEFKCDVCGFIAKNKSGLTAHMRKHKEV